MTLNKSHLGMCMVTTGHFIAIKISLGGKGTGAAAFCSPPPPLWCLAWLLSFAS